MRASVFQIAAIDRMQYPAGPTNASGSSATDAAVAVPGYLEKVYWWAYVHPGAVRVFERQWLVNAILWGNFARLRDAVVEELG